MGPYKFKRKPRTEFLNKDTIEKFLPAILVLFTIRQQILNIKKCNGALKKSLIVQFYFSVINKRGIMLARATKEIYCKNQNEIFLLLPQAQCNANQHQFVSIFHFSSHIQYVPKKLAVVVFLGQFVYLQGVPKKTGISVMAGVSKFFFSQIIFILLLDYGKIIEIFF